jgi:GT2 family glycosyltransferase
MRGKPDWLWMVDTDMEFDHDALERLVRSAHDEDTGEVKAHVVGGLCFGVHDGELWPTLYAVDTNDAGEMGVFRYNDYPRPDADEDCMFQVVATGAAFLLVHRTVLEQIAAADFNRTYPWFQETELQGKTCGEDFTFCLRAGQVGYPVWVNTAVRIGHHKSYVLREDMFLAQQEAKRERTA